MSYLVQYILQIWNILIFPEKNRWSCGKDLIGVDHFHNVYFVCEKMLVAWETGLFWTRQSPYEYL